MPKRPQPELTDETILMDSRLLTKKQAAGYLSCAVDTVSRWQAQGILPYIKLSKGPTGGVRFRIADLDAFILERHHGKTMLTWYALDKELPYELVARLIGGSVNLVKRRLERRKLMDRTPESIRRSIEMTYDLHMRVAIGQAFRERIIKYQSEIGVLRKVVANGTCSKCGGRLRRPS